MSSVQIPINSGFDRQRAMELANLVQRAYEQYNFDKNPPNNPALIPDFSPGSTITGSTTCDPAIPTDFSPILDPSRDGRVLYELLDVLKFTEYGLIFSKIVPFGFIAKRQTPANLGNVAEIFVILRGTLDAPELLYDFEFHQVPFLKNTNLGYVSSGFNKIYTHSNGNNESLGQAIIKILNDQQKCPPDSQIFVTGHSLGAALATLATVDIATNTKFQQPILYTYASPRVGDQVFAQKFRERELKHYRIANTEDLVPTVPPATGMLLGPEMHGQAIPGVDNAIPTKVTPARRSNAEFLSGLANTFRRNLTQQVYEHVGEPLYFTNQEGYITTNHNMFDVYRRALPQ